MGNVLGSLLKKRMILYMSEGSLKLLQMYVVVLNYRLAERESKHHANVGRIAGGVLSHFLLQHADEIKEEYERIKLDAIRARIPRLFTADQLDAIVATTGTCLPAPLRGGWTNGFRRTRPVRGNAGGPRSVVPRSTTKS